MIRKNINLDDISTETLDIGFVGEANHVEIAIHCAGFFKEYPDAAAMMTVAPPVGEMYPVQLDRDDQALIWEISEGDLAYAGAGTYQLTFTEDEEIIKTVYGSYSVSPSLVPTGDPPDPIENWIERAEEALAAFQQDVTTAEAWAAGTRDGEPVPSTDPAYENNSKYYAEEAAEIAASIPEDYSELSADVEEMKSSKAPVIINTASGAIASFSDGASGMPVKTLTVEIDPVQDLHGYDSPWPAGGGKNKFPITAVTQTLNGTTFTVASDGTITISGTPSAQTRLLLNSLSITPSADMKFSVTGSATGVRVFCRANNSGTITYPTISPSANIVAGVAYDQFILEVNTTFSGTSTTLKFQLESGSTATDWAPYSNECPISGWDSANVSSTGKNLWPTQTITKNGNTYYIGDGSTYTLFKAGTYVVKNSGTSSYMYWRKEGTSDNNVIHGNTNTGTFTLSEDCKIRFWFYSTDADATFTDIQIEVGSSPSSYESYSGSTIEYEFPEAAGTVYGGTLTIHQNGTGTLVVDRANVDLSALNYTKDTGVQNVDRFSKSIDDILPHSNMYSAANIVCSIYPVVSISSANNGRTNVCAVFNKSVYFYTPSGTFQDATDFKTAMSGQKLVYELATPVTYQLTNQQVIALLKGTNNVWADTGDVAVEYPADTKLYIDGKVAELQALILENISNS